MLRLRSDRLCRVLHDKRRYIDPSLKKKNSARTLNAYGRLNSEIKVVKVPQPHLLQGLPGVRETACHLFSPARDALLRLLARRWEDCLTRAAAPSRQELTANSPPRLLVYAGEDISKTAHTVRHV